jgi:hypothetical protein
MPSDVPRSSKTEENVSMPSVLADTPEEWAEISAIPALYLDSWHLYGWRGHIRVTMGEQMGDLDKYRIAFVMETNDVEAFAKQLLQMVERRKKKESTVKPAL